MKKTTTRIRRRRSSKKEDLRRDEKQKMKEEIFPKLDMTFYGQRVALHHTRTNKHTYKFLVHAVRTLWGNLNFIKKAKWTLSSFIFSIVENRPLLAAASTTTPHSEICLSVPHCPPRWPARAITTPRILIGHFFRSFFFLIIKTDRVASYLLGQQTRNSKSKKERIIVHHSFSKEEEEKTLLNLLSRT